MSGSIVEVPFQSDRLQAVRDGEAVWVVVRRVCDALGVDPEAQQARLTDKERSPWATTSVTQAVAADGKIRAVFAVDLDSLPMWLATISPKRVRPEARDKLIAYQKECARVLRDHFFGRQVAPPVASAETLTLLASTLERVTRLAEDAFALARDSSRRLDFIEQHVATGGRIPTPRLRQLKQDVKVLIEAEVAAGRWPTGPRRKDPARAARADIYRELGEATGWGGKANPWEELPATMEPVVRGVLRRRMRGLPKPSVARLHVVPDARQLPLGGLR